MGPVSQEYFICYSSVDVDLAHQAVAAVEAAGHRAWFAPREIPAGEPWPAHITRAIRDSDVLLLLGTSAAFDSRQVEREVAQADKRGCAILPVIVDDARSDWIEYYLGDTHELRTTRASFGMDLRRHFGLSSEQARYRFWNREVATLPNGHTFTFRRWGDGVGLPVLLLHGLGLNADDWDADAQVAAMAGRAATFIAPDLPQHCPWDDTVTTTLPDVAPLLGGLMSELGIERYAVIGHSLGGAIALHLTARDQRVVWCVAGGVGMTVWDAEARRRLSELLRRGQPDHATDEALLAFLRSRNADLHRLATLCTGSLPPPGDLARLATRVTLMVTPDDREQADALTTSAALPAALHLPGDHVSSWLSGDFLAAALDRTLPRASLVAKASHETALWMLVLSGLPGTGKTAIAAEIAPAFGMEVLSRDLVRHELVPSPTYSLQESELVAAELDRRARVAVEERRSLVIEGTGVQRDVRDALRARLQEARTNGFVTAALWLDAPPGTARERLASRALAARIPEDKSQADEGIYDVMRSRARPGWLGVRCDVTDATVDTVAGWVGAVLDGTVPAVDAPAYFLSQAVLAEAAGLAARSLSLPVNEWTRELLTHLKGDAASGVLRRWGDSTLIDDNVGQPLIAEVVLQQLLAVAGIEGGLERANAGVAHTYAYLFSPERTPFGHKRDRWLDGRLARILGVGRGRLQPVPRGGTLLSNLTAVLDAHLLGEASGWVDTAGVQARCLEEEDPDSGVCTRTFLLQRPRVGGGAAIYSVEVPGEGFRYITAFPVGDGFDARLDEAAREVGPLRGRFNAVLPPTSKVAARRLWPTWSVEGRPLSGAASRLRGDRRTAPSVRRST